MQTHTEMLEKAIDDTAILSIQSSPVIAKVSTMRYSNQVQEEIHNLLLNYRENTNSNYHEVQSDNVHVATLIEAQLQSRRIIKNYVRAVRKWNWFKRLVAKWLGVNYSRIMLN